MMVVMQDADRGRATLAADEAILTPCMQRSTRTAHLLDPDNVSVRPTHAYAGLTQLR